MDLTQNRSKLHADKIMNGQTVNYTVVFLISFIFMLVCKQILKGFSVPANISLLVSFLVTGVLNFFAVKRLVFHRKSVSPLYQQVLFFLLRMLVACGVYQLANFLFYTTLGATKSLVVCMTGIFVFLFNYVFDRYITFECMEKPEAYQNGRLYKTVFANRFSVLAFFLALFCILFIYLIYKLYPFGDLTVLRMDLYHQYGPLFTELYDRVTNLDSFLYSWETGGGSSFLGNYFNYLSSPLNIIIFLFDRRQMPFFVTTLVALKAALSAATMTYYLKKSRNANSYFSAGFGILYAFCGYFLAYYWNIMWIDAMYLLPLLVLGIEAIIHKTDCRLYIAVLCIQFFSSYYIAYMCCIFAVLYFLVYYFSNYAIQAKCSRGLWQQKGFSLKKVWDLRFIKSGVTFAAASVFSAALLAVVLIPVYMILDSCSATSDTFPTDASTYFNLFDLLANHLAGLTTTIRSSGGDVLPNIYSGILPVILVPLYIMNKDIRLREKVMHLLLVVFLLVSFDSNYLNFIWHAFHFPNDLPYRFSFMYSFVLIVIAFRVFQHFKAVKIRDIAAVGLALIVFITLVEKFPTNYSTSSTIFISLALVIVWCAALMLIKKQQLKTFAAGVIVLSLCICEVLVADCNSFVFTQNYSNYTENYDTYEESINAIKEQDDSFYRMELSHLVTRMDPSLYNYPGVSVFSSMAYEETAGLQYNLGMFGNRINSYTYNTQTPVYNMMFGLKYIMYTGTGARPSENLYTPVYTTSDGVMTVYENKYYLPVAYGVDTAVKDWKNYEGDPFAIQSDYFEKATGFADVFVPVIYNGTEGSGTSIDEVTQNGTFYYSNDAGAEENVVTLTLMATSSSNTYLYFTSPVIESITIMHGGEVYTQSTDNPYIFDIGQCEFGDEITVQINTKSDDATDSYFSIYAYSLDQDVLDMGYEVLNRSAMNVTDYGDTHIDGEITMAREGYLYTSVPYDAGWRVLIDGEEAQTFSLNGLLCTPISAGQHTVEMHYTPRGIVAGVCITAVAAAGGIAVLILRGRKRKKARAAVAVQNAQELPE